MAENTVKFSDLTPKASLALTDLLGVSDTNRILYSSTVQKLQFYLSTLDSTEFKGSLAISETPVEGWYFASESGIYVNVNNIVRNISGTITILVVTDPITNSQKVEIPVSITVDNTVIENSTNAVSGGAVFDSLALKVDTTTYNDELDEIREGNTIEVSEWKSVLSIENVDNTSDLNKPISTLAQSALDLKANQIDFNNVDNTSDLNKPISTATQTVIDLKLDISTFNNEVDDINRKLYGKDYEEE